MKKTILAILDGVGVSDNIVGNAVSLAKPKFLNYCLHNFPNVQLQASGHYVGLPDGQMGNSEVGHCNIGAGRIVPQTLFKINQSIESGEFFDNACLLQALEDAQNSQHNLHLIGLLSDGGIHSHISHLFALLKSARKYKINKIYLHLFLDGRDTEPSQAQYYLEMLDKEIQNDINVQIVSICGRYFGMDREKHWDRTNLAYQAIAFAVGKKYKNYNGFFNSTTQTIYDEFVHPFICSHDYQGVESGDTLIFFNFRADRMRQICYAFADAQMRDFEHKIIPNLNLYTLTNYDDNLKNYNVHNIFDDTVLKNTFTEVLINDGKKVLKVAETTKYAHVTYFFNGGVERPFHNEDRILIPSINVASFDIRPKMCAKQIANNVIKAVKNDDYDSIIFNFANGDMVGHSGNLDATIKAMKYISKQLNRIYKVASKKGYALVITADHGNAEKMLDSSGNMWTAHTLNAVSFIICDKSYQLKDGDFALGNIAPTILDIMGIKPPKEMTEISLIKH